MLLSQSCADDCDDTHFRLRNELAVYYVPRKKEHENASMEACADDGHCCAGVISLVRNSVKGITALFRI